MSTNTHQDLNGRVRHAPYMTKCEVHLEEDQYERPSIALKIRRGEFAGELLKVTLCDNQALDLAAALLVAVRAGRAITELGR